MVLYIWCMGLDIVELIVEVEKWFDITIPDAEAEKACTVGKLVDCIGRIKGIHTYDFSLREQVFLTIRNLAVTYNDNASDFQLTQKVSASFPGGDPEMLGFLERESGLNFPGFYLNPPDKTTVLGKIKNWFLTGERIDFSEISWKRYTDLLIANNLEHFIGIHDVRSKYEIYLVVMKLTVDKTGVGYSEVALKKSFTDDLGID